MGFTNLNSILTCFAEAIDLTQLSDQMRYHRTAYLSYHLAKEMGFSEIDCRNVVTRTLFNGMLDVVKSSDYSFQDAKANASSLVGIGKTLLKLSPASWQQDSGSNFSMFPIMKKRMLPGICENIMNVSGKIVTTLSPKEPVLSQIDKVLKAYTGNSEIGSALERLAAKSYIWMNLCYSDDLLSDLISNNTTVSLEDTISLTEMISLLIDFRSPFTAMHSAGVSASAVCIAELCGMSDSEQKKMHIAGNLHDLGKLRIPASILEKNGKLTDEEFSQIKEHAFFTYRILKKMDGFEEIAEWAGFHHEKLNGAGYPFGLNARQIPMGAKIMSVADIFSAITEDRPYRKGMDKDKALSVLRENVTYEAISGVLVELLADNYEQIDFARKKASREAGKRYFDAIEGGE